MGPEITIIRHGETEWSRSGQHTGRTDIPLTGPGERQAKDAARLVAGTRFDLVLVSPRQRAARTAELAGLEPITVDEDLVEWDYGELEGLTTPQIQERFPGWSIWDGPWPGGETVEQVSARADRVLARCLAQPDGAQVALVGHGHFSRVLGARWVRLAATGGRHLYLSTAAVCRLSWEHDDPVLALWNATAGDD